MNPWECPLTQDLVIFIQVFHERQPQKAGRTGDVPRAGIGILQGVWGYSFRIL